MLYIFIAAFAVCIGMLLYWYWQDEVQRCEEERNSNFRTCRIEVLEDRCYLSGASLDDDFDYYEPPENICDYYYYSTPADSGSTNQNSLPTSITLPDPIYSHNLLEDGISIVNSSGNYYGLTENNVGADVLNALDEATNLTITATFNVDSVGGWHYIAAKDCPTNQGAEIFLRIHNGVLQFGYWDTQDDHMAETEVSANTWYNVAGTFDGATWKLYVNGILKDTKPFHPDPQYGITNLDVNNNGSTAAWYVGRHAEPNDIRIFGGVIENVTIYGEALTEVQILAAVNAGTEHHSETLAGEFVFHDPNLGISYYTRDFFVDGTSRITVETGNYGRITDPTALNFLDMMETFTFAATFNVDFIGGWHYILCRDCPTNQGAEIFLRINNGNLQFGYWDTQDDHMAETTVDADTWYDVVGTYDGNGNWKLYVNGELKDTKMYKPQHAITELDVKGQGYKPKWYIGRHAEPNDMRIFGGEIAEIAIYQGAITAPEFFSDADIESDPLAKTDDDYLLFFMDSDEAGTAAEPWSQPIQAHSIYSGFDNVTIKYAFADDVSSDSPFQIDEDTGIIRLTRTLSAAECADTHTFDITAMLCVNGIATGQKDTATINVKLISIGFTPYSPGIVSLPIPEATWKKDGVKIRRNWDDDNGNGIADYLDDFCNGNENDLVRLYITTRQMNGVEYRIRPAVGQPTDVIKLWRYISAISPKISIDGEGGVPELIITENFCRLWAEYAGNGYSNVKFEIVAVSTKTGNVLKKLEFEFNRTNSDEPFSPKVFARQYITNSPNGANWGFANKSEKDDIYATGCAGIAMVSIGKDHLGAGQHYGMFPEGLPDTTILGTYDAAKALYEQYRNAGENPALIMRTNWNGTPLHTDSSLPLRNRLPSYDDYLTLANIDIGNGEQPCWLHAEGGWKWGGENSGTVVVTPVEDYAFGAAYRAVFIVVKNAGRTDANGNITLQYKLTFAIPDIPVADLPKSYDEFLV